MTPLEQDLNGLGWECNPAYGTHLESVRRVVSEILPDEIFVEVGAGRYGTPWLANLTYRDSITIEDVSTEVAEIFKRHCSTPTHTVDFCATPEYLRKLGESVTIGGILIDGARHLRRDWLKVAFAEKIPYIVLHDSDKASYYGYHRIKVPPAYFSQSFRHETLHTATTAFSTRPKSSTVPQEHVEGGMWPDV